MSRSSLLYIYMMTIIRAFFVTLGGIFFLLLLGLAYIWFFNLWQVQTLTTLWLDSSPPVERPWATSSSATLATTTATSGDDTGASEGSDGTQAEAMTEAGVDESYFTSLSEAEIQCFRNRLGDARVDEIIAGGMPTTAEIISGLSCVE